MNSITWLLQHFGFTYREVADALILSPAMLHLAHKQHHSLPKKTQKLLEHRLFTFPNLNEIPPGPPEPEILFYDAVEEGRILVPAFPDTRPEIRLSKWRQNKNLCIVKIDKLRQTQYKIEKRFFALQARMEHTKELGDSGSELDYVEQWWVYQRRLADLELLDFTTRENWEKQLVQIRVLEAEIRMINRFFAGG